MTSQMPVDLFLAPRRQDGSREVAKRTSGVPGVTAGLLVGTRRFFRQRVKLATYGLRSSSGSLVKFAAIRPGEVLSCG